MQHRNINSHLIEPLKRTFFPLGINAYSLCCGWPCVSTYTREPGFKLRCKQNEYGIVKEGGLYAFNFELNRPHLHRGGKICALYGDGEYTTNHWEEEKKFIVLFCEVLGKEPHEYTFETPHNRPSPGILEIQFKTPLEMDDSDNEEDDESSDESSRESSDESLDDDDRYSS